MAIIPLYSSVLDDSWRLVFCLLGHPILMEICLFGFRGIEYGFLTPMQAKWNNGGKEAYYQNGGLLLFHFEAILVLERRFLIG